MITSDLPLMINFYSNLQLSSYKLLTGGHSKKPKWVSALSILHHSWSDTIRVAVWTKHRICFFFEKINFFFHFGGSLKTFLTPKDLIWPQKPHFWGGLTSKTFWSELRFWRFPGLIMPKNCYFAICSSKTVAWIKKF